nr:integrase, catalytic region, zinc finger, CCHC-type, peptidase aspartic, catalytic [Tanacetum cinerariifolium]
LKETLSKLKGKAIVNEAVTLHPIDPELLEIDVAPLAPKLRNNMTAHNDYLNHTQEETATLREIVKNERLLNPLNTSLDYAYGVDLLTDSQGNNLYTLSLQDMMASSPICLFSKASKTNSWLWHRYLSHLNFGAINHLARQGLVRGLPKLKFEKDHLCSACAMGKIQAESTSSPSSTSVDQDVPSPTKSQTTPKTQSSVIPQDVEEDTLDIEVAQMGNDSLFGVPILVLLNLHQRYRLIQLCNPITKFHNTIANGQRIIH